MNAVVTYEEKRGLAAAFVKSKLFGITDEAQALALMALCEAEGMHPAKAIQEYHIIQGKPALKADAMLARFQRAGGSVSWGTYTDEQVTGTFTHPQGGSITVEWTAARAAKAGITNPMWKKYPRNMMRSRCISEGVRAVFPGIATGIYTVEEVQDMPAVPAADMGRVEVVVDEAIAAKLRACKTLHELAHAWEGLSPAQRRSVASIKDEVKASLAETVEDAKPVDEFVADMEAAEAK
jgi:hypothetical protein